MGWQISRCGGVVVSAADAGFALPSLEDAWDILLIDELQRIQEERDWQVLCALIRESTDRRFVLLSRGIPPACKESQTPVRQTA